MKYKDLHYPLYLNKNDILDQITTIGIAFNRYNILFNSKTKSYRCCCVATIKNKIVSIGINRSKTHPDYKIYADKMKFSIHAEIDMIMNIKDQLQMNKITDIYTIRGHINLLDSFPCPLCLEYIIKKFNNNTVLHYYKDLKWKKKLISDF